MNLKAYQYALATDAEETGHYQVIGDRFIAEIRSWKQGENDLNEVFSFEFRTYPTNTRTNQEIEENEKVGVLPVALHEVPELVEFLLPHVRRGGMKGALRILDQIRVQLIRPLIKPKEALLDVMENISADMVSLQRLCEYWDILASHYREQEKDTPKEIATGAKLGLEIALVDLRRALAQLETEWDTWPHFSEEEFDLTGQKDEPQPRTITLSQEEEETLKNALKVAQGYYWDFPDLTEEENNIEDLLNKYFPNDEQE